jgi:capsular exopolysaccharide synthesis family protein
MNELTNASGAKIDRLARFLPNLNIEQNEQSGFSFKIADLRGIIWRQRRVVIATIAIALFLGLAISLLMTPKFTAEVLVQVGNEQVKVLNVQDVDPAVALNDTNRYLNTQGQILQSRAVAMRVIDDLGLDKNDKFLKAMRVGVPNQKLPANWLKQARREAAISVLQGNLKVTVPIDDRVMKIDFSSPDALVSAQVANSYARNFVANNIQTGLDSNAYARKVLAEQIETDRAALNEAEQKAIAYAQQNHLIDASDASGGSGATDSKMNSAGSGNSQSITTANLVRLNGQYIDAVTQRILAEQRWHTAASTPIEQLAEVASNVALQGLIAQRSEAANHLAQMKAKYQPNFPALVQAEAQYNAVDAQVAHQVADIRASIKYQYSVALQQEKSIADAREKLSNQTLDEQRRRVQLNMMARDVDASRHQLDDLMGRYNQVSAASEIVRNNISILDLATVPSVPTSPNLLRNMLIALIAGIALATLLMISLESLDDTLRSPEDVETKLGLTLLGTTPKLKDDDMDRDGLDAKSMLTEAYYSIRVSLDYSTSTGSPETLLVTSSQPSEGKTTTAIALAMDYARIGKKVLLIDGDFRRPSLHVRMGLPRNKGFTDVLLGAVALEDCVVPHPGAPNLDLLVLGKVPPNPVEILSSNVISDFLAQHKPDYDLIVIDSAPVMGLADTPLIARQVQTLLMIVEANRAHNGQAKTAVRRLQEAGVKIAGVVMTKFDHRNAGYNYDYHYRYYTYENSEAA